MKVADEVWTSLALLHRENPERRDFAVDEIKARARQEGWVIRPGFNIHASYHCVANKPANPATHRMLFEDARGRKRLYRPGDPCHPERQHGRIRPEKRDLPSEYQPLVDWFDNVYCKQAPSMSKAGPAANEVTVPHQFPPAENLALKGYEEMQSSTAFLGPSGTLVLPDYLQKELDLKEGACLSIYRDQDRIVILPITEEYIARVCGSLKGNYSLAEDLEREHRAENEKER